VTAAGNAIQNFQPGGDNKPGEALAKHSIASLPPLE